MPVVKFISCVFAPKSYKYLSYLVLQSGISNLKKKINVWFSKRDKKNNEHRYQNLLDHAERKKAAAMVSEQQRIRFIEVRAKLRWVLASYLKIDAKTLVFSQAEYGKPFLPDYPDCHFNISHSGDYLAIAVTNSGEIGIDIEKLKQKSDFYSLVKRCFAEVEQAYWLELPESRKCKEFYRFWTRKEAFVKATGRGIALGLSQCVISPDDPSKMLNVPADYAQEKDWRLYELECPEGLSGAIAIRGQDFKIRSKTL